MKLNQVKKKAVKLFRKWIVVDAGPLFIFLLTCRALRGLYYKLVFNFEKLLLRKHIIYNQLIGTEQEIMKKFLYFLDLTLILDSFKSEK